jgi:predicted RND superfamily exporter protein
MLNFKKKDDTGLLLRVVTLETKLKEQEKKIIELESLLQAVKQVAGETKKSNETARKNKWLNSYPDETEGKV